MPGWTISTGVNTYQGSTASLIQFIFFLFQYVVQILKLFASAELQHVLHVLQNLMVLVEF